MEGNVRRLEPGSIPSVWRKSEISIDQSLSHRSRRKVCIRYAIILFLNCIPCALIATCFS